MIYLEKICEKLSSLSQREGDAKADKKTVSGFDSGFE
jgi:hypothetical protein